MRTCITAFICLWACLPVSAQKFEGLALTPPMGWNSWNTFGTGINEALILGMADALANGGYRDAGYTYLVLDDGWMARERDSVGNLVPDPIKFPNGLKPVIDYVLGNDVRNASATTREILTNREVIAVDQDAPGIQGYPFWRQENLEIWAKPLQGGDWAICFLNRGDMPLTLRHDWSAHPVSDDISKNYQDFKKDVFVVRDLWKRQNTGTTQETLNAVVPPHDVLMLRLSRSK